MKSISKKKNVGVDLMDIFSISVNLDSENEHQNIHGYYGLASITFGYQLSSVDNGACYPPRITHSNEGKWRYISCMVDKDGLVAIYITIIGKFHVANVHEKICS